jgi:hypothetical protein
MRKQALFLVLFLASCSVATPQPIASQTSAPTFTPAPQTSTPQPTETSAPVLIPAHEKYTLDTTIDYDSHRVTVNETILYPNHTGQSLEALTLLVAANLWQNCFGLTALNVNGAPITDYTLSAHRLVVPLPTPIEPDSVSELHLTFSLSLPYMDQVNSQRARIFGYSDIQMNLVNWYPFVAPFMDGDWVVREPWSHGEYLVYPSADFEVNLTFANPENIPVVATSGFPESSTRYTLTDGRAFAISASRDFEVSSAQVGDVTVYSYYLPIYKSAGEAAMKASAQAVQVYSEKFGAYPHKTLSVVMADFKDSMEFSAFYFHSRSFYDLYDGTPQNYLTFIAAHETGHQWWFDQVANDQALHPWLDESLTTYSEVVFYEALYPDLLPWWWSYRIDYFEPDGFIDIPVYEGQNADTYKYIVYLNGARFLKDLRAEIGDDAFFAFLRDYFAQNRGRIAGEADFFRVLDEHTSVDYSPVVRKYFRNR